MVSDISAYGLHWGVFIKEGFWFIVETEGNEDEAEIYEFERPGLESGPGYPPQDAA